MAMVDLILWKDRELGQLRNEMDRMIKDFFRDFGTSVFEEVYGEAMMVDIVEKSDAVVITVQLPGIEPEDVDLEVSSESLVIGAVRKDILDSEDGRFTRSQKFSNRIKLPCRIEPEKVKAGYQDNILEIILPKCSSRTFRKVTISQSRK
jgi:HSP20 family protein